MQMAWKKAVAITFLGTVACRPLALAQLNPNVRHVTYEFHQNTIYNPAFEIAWTAMADLYKDSIYAKVKTNVDNPLIGIGEVALNRDEMYEIIARPTEDEENEKGQFCKADYTCPHYVLEVRDRNVHTLAVIYANSIDRGDSVKNGYWTLKAYPYDGTDSAKAGIYETYEYDAKTDRYIKQAAQSAPASKP